MKIDVTYEQVVAEAPQAVQAALAKLRNSRSKYRSCEPELLTWHYNWSITIRAYTAAELFNGKVAEDQQREQAMTPEERSADIFSRIHASVAVENVYHATLNTLPDTVVRAVKEAYGLP